MNAADLLNRAEQRAKAWALTRTGGLLLLGLAVLVGVYTVGVRSGRASEQAKQSARALQQNAAAIGVEHQLQDSLKKVDRAMTDTVNANRVALRQLQARVHVGGTVSHPTISVDSGPALPVDPVLPVLLTKCAEQTTIDSVHVGLKDQRIVVYEKTDTLYVQRDSLRVVDAKALEHRGFWRGVKVGAIAGVVVVAELVHLLRR